MTDQLTGIVLCGGKSSRMGKDKSLLIYHSQPQRYHVYDMLKITCGNVYISCNEFQVNSMLPGIEFIVDLDAYTGAGPLTGILSAFDQAGKTDLLVIGCDYPFINREEISNFISTIDRKQSAAFFDEATGFYEPMLAYYPADSYGTFIKMYSNKQYSLQQYLRSCRASKYIPANQLYMKSINTTEEYNIVKDQFSSKTSSE